MIEYKKWRDFIMEKNNQGKEILKLLQEKYEFVCMK